MKYLRLLLTVVLTPTSLLANDYFSEIRYENRAGRSGQSDSGIYGVALGGYIDNIFEIDFFSRKKYPRSDSDNLRLELGGKYKYSLNTSVSLFTRVATGKEYRPNDNYSYWNIENGIKSRINSHLDGIFSLRFRDSYNQNKWRAFDRTYRAGLIYKASEIVSINLNYNHARGEIQFDGVGLNIKVNF